MGQLRSALAAASRVADGPAQALDVLGRYAGFVDGAENTTAVTCFVDWEQHTITYSSAGRPPPAHLQTGSSQPPGNEATFLCYRPTTADRSVNCPVRWDTAWMRRARSECVTATGLPAARRTRHTGTSGSGSPGNPPRRIDEGGLVHALKTRRTAPA
jgi:hypothetical protein